MKQIFEVKGYRTILEFDAALGTFVQKRIGWDDFLSETNGGGDQVVQFRAAGKLANTKHSTVQKMQKQSLA
jgi:hypothetical protein